MKIWYEVHGELDVVNLFLHDKHDCWPLCDDFVAKRVKEWLVLKTGMYDINVLTPSESGLDRFVLEVGDDIYSERCHTADDLWRAWPSRVFRALLSIKEITQEDCNEHPRTAKGN